MFILNIMCYIENVINFYSVINCKDEDYAYHVHQHEGDGVIIDVNKPKDYDNNRYEDAQDIDEEITFLKKIFNEIKSKIKSILKSLLDKIWTILLCYIICAIIFAVFNWFIFNYNIIPQQTKENLVTLLKEKKGIAKKEQESLWRRAINKVKIKVIFNSLKSIASLEFLSTTFSALKETNITKIWRLVFYNIFIILLITVIINKVCFDTWSFLSLSTIAFVLLLSLYTSNEYLGELDIWAVLYITFMILIFCFLSIAISLIIEFLLFVIFIALVIYFIYLKIYPQKDLKKQV